MTIKHGWKSLVAAGVLAALSGALPGAAGADGMFRYATVGEPPSLDQQVVTSDLATTIAHHMFEGLYTFDASNSPVPLLASGDTVSDDGRTITIALREGVTFHDGSAMDSEDVVASLTRWGEHGSRGALLFDQVEALEATGPHEIVLTLKAPFGPWKNLMAFINGGPAIYPAEVASAAGAEPIGQDGYIGTGPYRFSEWRPNRHVELVRFDDYASPEGEADGYGGRREALFDTLRFVPVPDVGTRVAGLQAGDYDYAESIQGDLYETLEADPAVTTVLNGGPIFGLVFTNSKARAAGERTSRCAAPSRRRSTRRPRCRSPSAPNGCGAPTARSCPRATCGTTSPAPKPSARGTPEKAKAMAEEAGYAGEPIKFMVSTNYGFHYDQAVVFTKQLAEAGFNIDLQVYDWATLIQNRAEPEAWDLFFTHHGFVPDPILISVMNDDYPGWWATPEKRALKAKFTQSPDPAEREALWGELQALIYEQVPTMKTGDVYTYNIASPELTGLDSSTLIWPAFWNVDR